MRPRHPLRRGTLLATLVLCASLVTSGLFAGTSTAATSKTTTPPTGVAGARSQLAAAIAVRQVALRRVLGAAGSSKTIVPDNQAMLTALLTQALTGMNALAAKVPSDTTQEEVAADQTAMVQDYRVLALQVPAADMVLAADFSASIEAQMSARVPGIQSALAPAANQASPVPATVKSAFTDFQRQLAAAESATAGVSSSLLALLPESYPSNQGVLTSARSDLANARRDLGLAVTDLDTIVTHVHH
ncbi:MAG TPA: hypothetical protein VIX85_06605 [Acidimicrobiales bacterium]